MNPRIPSKSDLKSDAFDQLGNPRTLIWFLSLILFFLFCLFGKSFTLFLKSGAFDQLGNPRMKNSCIGSIPVWTTP